MCTLTVFDLEQMDEQAFRAVPTQLRLWAAQIREARGSMRADEGEYADALLLKLEHGIRSQLAASISEASGQRAMLHFDFLVAAPVIEAKATTQEPLARRHRRSRQEFSLRKA